MTATQPTRIYAVLLGLLIATGAIVYDIVTTKPEGPQFSQELSDVILPMPKPIQAFRLLDHNRKVFDLEQLKGKWSFVFFGYTHCPDVCPTAMAILAELFERMKKQAPDALIDTRLIFVTVDPERDTPEHLRQYVGYFNPDFLGVTGEPKDIKAFSNQLGALYFKGSQFKDADKPPAKSPQEPTEEEKMVSHTSAFFLMDPLGRMLAIFPEFNNSDMIFEDYKRIRTFAKIHNLYQGKHP